MTTTPTAPMVTAEMASFEGASSSCGTGAMSDAEILVEVSNGPIFSFQSAQKYGA